MISSFSHFGAVYFSISVTKAYLYLSTSSSFTCSAVFASMDMAILYTHFVNMVFSFGTVEP